MKRRILTTLTVAVALAASACSSTASDTSCRRSRRQATSSASSTNECRADAAPASSPASCSPTAPPASPVPATTTDDRSMGTASSRSDRSPRPSRPRCSPSWSTTTRSASTIPWHHCSQTGTSVPSRDGHQITLEDLATHTSGLPRNPANLDAADPDNPYADYTVTQLYDFLASYELTTDPGSHFEYSNVGAALLGHALALRAGIPFEDLVRTRILEPLDMTSTGITLDPATAQRFVDGHDARGNVTSRFDMPVLAGAGALRSSVNDMLKFAAANLDPHGDDAAPGDGRGTRTPHAHRRRRPRDRARLERRHRAAATRSSGTAAPPAGSSPTSASTRFTRPPQSSSATRAPRTSTTSASTSSTPASRSCRRRRRAPKPPCPPQSSPATSVTTTSSASTATITQAADGLTVHLPGEEPDRLYAESPTVFFFKDFDGHVNFQLDADGDVTSGTFHDQDGQMASITRRRIQITLLTRSSIDTSAPTTSTAPKRPSPGPPKDSPQPSPTGPSSCTPRQRRGSSSRSRRPGPVPGRRRRTSDGGVPLPERSRPDLDHGRTLNFTLVPRCGAPHEVAADESAGTLDGHRCERAMASTARAEATTH